MRPARTAATSETLLLLGLLVLLYSAFKSMRDATRVLLNLPFALGGVVGEDAANE